jgi:hypothetical protein
MTFAQRGFAVFRAASAAPIDERAATNNSAIARVMAEVESGRSVLLDANASAPISS